ncbi:cytochrome c oxidase subunit 2 [Phyllobacterium endophyticum]|nr:cytochrome c oxidase subunit 2 [Phyllobacterium endophyticum]
MKKNIVTLMGVLSGLLSAGTAHAAQPEPWQMTFQPAASAIMEQIIWFERYTLWFIVPITLFVMVLLAWVMFRYRASANPVPSKTSHNTAVEIIWTVGPVVVLLFLAIPSFQLLTAQYSPEDPKLTIKATGYQWYWGYEYQAGEAPVSFDSVMLKETDRAATGKEDKKAYPRLLAVDNEMVVPVNTTVRLLVTGADVIHSFSMPAFGVKMDAVAGRSNETWFKADKEGMYYGQCSQICGKDHAFMPIAIHVVSQDKYDAWFTAAGKDLPGAYKTLAAAIDADKNVSVAGN